MSGWWTGSYAETRGTGEACVCALVVVCVCVHVCVHVCIKAATLWEGLTPGQAMLRAPGLAQEREGWAWKVERAWLALAAFSKTGVQMLAQLA